MWEIRPIERRMQEALRAHRYGEARGEDLIARYLHARGRIIDAVVQHIPGVEPSLTDHGPDHIGDVLDQAFRLLGEDTGFALPAPYLSPVELYCLCLGILYHDVGNVFKRERHERQIAKVYDWVTEGQTPSLNEKKIIVQGAGAHAGETESGSKDTLRQLPAHESLHGEPVRLPEIAALIRFADELAEGPHRTSEFMRRFGLYDISSEMYHEYARVTNVRVDRGGGRIVLTYSFDLRASGGDPTPHVASLRLKLQFILKRIAKLDQERQYARHYSRILEPFRAVESTFNFWLNGELHDLDLAPLITSDVMVTPGSEFAEKLEKRAGYDIDQICAMVQARLEAEGA